MWDVRNTECQKPLLCIWFASGNIYMYMFGGSYRLFALIFRGIKDMANIYLDTIFAETPAHGLFSVTPSADGTLNKIPQGEHGCASFTSRAGDLKTSKTLLLGRAFGAGDGVIGIDVDGSKPDHAWHSSAGYREVSASGTGLHIIARVPAELIPASGSKIVLKGQEHNIEIFYGKNNGIALTGTDATYTVPDLDMFSPAGQLVKTELEKKIKQLTEQHTTTPRKKEPKPATPRSSCEELAGIITTTQRWAILSNKTLPSSASEAFQAVCNRIAGDLGQMEAYTAHTDILTTTNIRVVWESTEIYRHHYAGKKKYAAHKIDPTLQKALIYGLKRKSEALASMKWSKKKTTPEAAKSEPKPQQTQKLEPEKPKHPEGFCVSEDGVPEFWCNEYDHPLRYHMAHIARYAQTAMQQPNAITAWICAVFFCTAVCARQYAAELAPFGNGDSALIYPRLYAIVSGKSGAGKDDINNGMIALVHAIAEGSHNKHLWELLSRNSNWTSDAAVHAAIAERPQSVAIWDECGRKIQRAKDDVIAASMLSKLTEAFSRANGVLMAPHYANPKDQQLPKGTNVWRPAMSVIGLGTPRQMEAITEEMVENGQFARFLYYMIPLCITKPVERVKFDLKTHAAINEILATATFAPDVRITARQELQRVLRWNPNAPHSAAAIRDNIRQLAIAAKSDADVAILNRVFEVAGILAISRTILGTKRGLNAEYIEYDTMMECIAEAKKSMWHFHELIVDAPVYTPRELRIADAIEEIYREQLKSPFRAYFGRDIAPLLKLKNITLGGFRGEHHHIDMILIGRGIGAGKEGNTPTGRKYYYEASTETAQAEQDEYDNNLKNAAKAAVHQKAE